MNSIIPAKVVHTLKAPAAAAAALLLLASNPAQADFSSPYAINPPANGTIYATTVTTIGVWNVSRVGNGGFPSPQLTLNAPISLTLDTGFPVGNNINNGLNLTVSTAIVDSGVLSFSYQLSRANTNNNRGGYYLNGVFTQLTNATGSVQNLAVNAGDIFGFSAQAGPQLLSAGIQSRTMLTISDFNVSAIPEPATACFGLLALAACFTRRSRLRAA